MADDPNNAATMHIATITLTAGTDDLGALPILKNVGISMPHATPQPGKAIGGIISYTPKEMTIGRRLETCTRLRDMVVDRVTMSIPRQFTFRLLKGDDNSVSRSISVTNAHITDYWIETALEDRGDGVKVFVLYEYLKFQPEGVTF